MKRMKLEILHDRRRDVIWCVPVEKGHKDFSARRPVQDVAVIVSDEHVAGGAWVNVVVKGNSLPPDFLRMVAHRYAMGELNFGALNDYNRLDWGDYCEDGPPPQTSSKAESSGST
jgi:hypothetical protein